MLRRSVRMEILSEIISVEWQLKNLNSMTVLLVFLTNKGSCNLNSFDKLMKINLFFWRKYNQINCLTFWGLSFIVL